MKTFLFRAVGAALLNPSAFEDVEGDRSAIWQALLVVLLSSVAAGVALGGGHEFDPGIILAFSALALVTWLAWAALIRELGGRVFPELQTRVDFGQLVRTTGFAAAPGALQLLGVVAPIRTYVFAIAWIWMLVAMVIAVRQALDYRSVRHAAGICVIALAVVALATLVLATALERTVS